MTADHIDRAAEVLGDALGSSYSHAVCRLLVRRLDAAGLLASTKHDAAVAAKALRDAADEFAAEAHVMERWTRGSTPARPGAPHRAGRLTVCDRWDALARHLTHLDCDDDRTPQPDPDTVTLRRDDVEALLNHGTLTVTQRAEAIRRARAALGWGDSAHRETEHRAGCPECQAWTPPRHLARNPGDDPKEGR